MKDIKEIFYVIIGIAIAITIFVLIGKGISYARWHSDQERNRCTVETKNYYYCERIW